MSEGTKSFLLFIQSIPNRKFILVFLLSIYYCVAFWVGKMSEQAYIDLMRFFIAMYIVGNVGQKMVVKEDSSA